MLHLENFQTFLDQLKKSPTNNDNSPASYVHCNDLFIEGFMPDTELCWFQVVRDPNHIYKNKVFFGIKGTDEKETEATIMFMCPLYTQRFYRNVTEKKNLLRSISKDDRNYKIIKQELADLKGDLSHF
jgi:hypothetical protein